MNVRAMITKTKVGFSKENGTQKIFTGTPQDAQERFFHHLSWGYGLTEQDCQKIKAELVIKEGLNERFAMEKDGSLFRFVHWSFGKYECIIDTEDQTTTVISIIFTE